MEDDRKDDVVEMSAETLLGMPKEVHEVLDRLKGVLPEGVGVRVLSGKELSDGVEPPKDSLCIPVVQDGDGSVHIGEDAVNSLDGKSEEEVRLLLWRMIYNDVSDVGNRLLSLYRVMCMAGKSGMFPRMYGDDGSEGNVLDVLERILKGLAEYEFGEGVDPESIKNAWDAKMSADTKKREEQEEQEEQEGQEKEETEG